MADILTGATGFAIDNVVVGTTSYRQTVIVAGASSGQYVIASSSAPAGTEVGLYVRPIGSSGVVLGSVGPSSVWSMVLNASSGTVVGSVAPSSTWSVTPTSGALVILSSGPAQIGALGPSSANVVGSVAPSSVWSMVLNASSAVVIGSVAPSSQWSVSPTSQGIQLGTAGLLINSTANVWTQVGFSTSTGQGSTDLTIPVKIASPSSAVVVGSVAPSSTWTVTPTSGALVVLSSGPAQIGALGPSSANVVGSVAPSSVWSMVLNASSATVIGSVAPSSKWTLGPSTESIGALSSGSVTIGALTTGTVVGLTTTNFLNLTTSLTNYTRAVAASTQGATPADFGIQVSGIVASTGQVAAQTSGNTQIMSVDPYGRPLVNLYASFRAFATANLIMASNTSQQALIASQGTSAVAHITAITAWSTAGTTTLAGTYVTLYSSCGQADPGRWRFPLSFVPAPVAYNFDFDPPLTQPTAGNGWFAVSSSSGVPCQIQVQYFFTTK